MVVEAITAYILQACLALDDIVGFGPVTQKGVAVFADRVTGAVCTRRDPA